MTRVICCRHGQSVANAGAATSDPLAIPLTELGLRQAEEVAQQWHGEPGLIVVSPAERARATAAPTIRRFPEAPHEEWPIHEFTYLNRARCVGTTGAQRRTWVEAYWTKADPTFCDGAGAESFLDFLVRVHGALSKLSEVHFEDRPVLLFGHGQFINAVRWRLADACSPQDMLRFRKFDLGNPVEHCAPIEIILEANLLT